MPPGGKGLELRSRLRKQRSAAAVPDGVTVGGHSPTSGSGPVTCRCFSGSGGRLDLNLFLYVWLCQQITWQNFVLLKRPPRGSRKGYQVCEPFPGRRLCTAFPEPSL